MTFLSAIVRTQGRRPVSLAQAVESLRNQLDDDLEVIVVVHGDDAVAEIVAHSVPVGQVIAVAGGGRAAPLNAGLDAATGDYIAFLDDDDLALPEWVSTFRRGARLKPGAVVRVPCLSQRWLASHDGEPVEAIDEPHQEFSPDFDLVAHFHSNSTPICSIALPRLELAASGLRFDEELPVLEDWDLFLRAVLALDISPLSEPATSIYRRVDQGNSFDHSTADWTAARARILERLDSSELTLPSGSASALAAAHQSRLDLSYQVSAASAGGRLRELLRRFAR